jgi:hypothetical protein
MGFVDRMSSSVRLWYHKREIETALRHYQKQTGREGGKKEAFSESGSFQSQLHRLFSVGSADETGQLRDIAASAVNLCITNKYYKPADFLSDVIDALESWTYLSTEPDGEPPLSELVDQPRRAKLEQVERSWLIPMKVAAVETLLERLAGRKDRSLGYQALGRFEREAARLFSLVEEAEVTLVEQAVQDFLDRWRTDARLKERFPEPAVGLQDTLVCFNGEMRPEGTDDLRVRRYGQPFRLSTLVPEDRQHLIKAALERLQPEGN